MVSGEWKEKHIISTVPSVICYVGDRVGPKNKTKVVNVGARASSTAFRGRDVTGCNQALLDRHELTSSPNTTPTRRL